MVSLMRRSEDLSSGGARYFDDAQLNREDFDSEMLEPLHGQSETFHGLHTIVPVVLKIVLIVIIQISVILLICLWPQFRYHCEPFIIMLYIHAAFWCISWLLHQHLKWKHKMLRINGYLEFYRQTEHHVRAQFYIVSLWNALLLVVSGIYHYMYKEMEQRCLSPGSLSPNNVVGALLSIETSILVPVLTTYIVRVWKFNVMRPPPDVQHEDWMMSFVRESFSAGDVGFRESTEHVHDLLEKQADLIRYLHEHNAMLSHKLIQLSSRTYVEPECT